MATEALAKSIPKPDWNRHQCSKWLVAYLCHYCNWTAGDAGARAESFNGSGSTLYMTGRNEWVKSLGNDAGLAVFAVLFSYNNDSNGKFCMAAYHERRGGFKYDTDKSYY